MDTFAIDQAVASYLPDDFLMAAIKSLFLAKKLAYDSCCTGEFAEPEIANVMPYHIRGKMEGLLRGTAERFPSMTSDMILVAGWNHTEIKSGPFTLTAHAVDSPCGMVDDAKYRKSLAESQSSLIGPEEVMPDAKLYALFLHSPYQGLSAKDRREHRYLPGSAYLALPEAALKRYAHRIDLFAKFPALVDGLLPKEWDNAARAVYRWQASQKVA